MKNITLSNSEKLNFISNLSTMISAGIPIISVFHSLSQEARGNIKKILDSTTADMLQGKHLYMAFSKFPQVFDSITINMIHASEETGGLDVVLKDMKIQIKKDIEFNRKVWAALIYPILVILVFFAVLFMILIVVIPKIASVFTQLKVTLPLPTKVLIFSSNIIIHQTLLFIAAILFVILVLTILYKSQRKRILHFFYTFPLISTIIRDIDLMRFSRSLHLLLSSGVTITSALNLTEQVVYKPEIKKAIFSAKQAILSGKTLSFSLKQHKKIFPNTMIELVQAGERTGSIDRSMQDISEYFENKVSDNLSLATALLEPLMLIIIAVLVGGMMLAIIAPIYSLVGKIGQL